MRRVREPWMWARGHHVRRGGGATLTVGPLIASGGQGVVYEVEGDQSRVLKQIKPAALADAPEFEQRVRAMVAGRPESWREPASGHVLLAWPEDVVLDGGRFAGLVMPRIDGSATVELHVVANPSDRRRREPGTPPWVAAFTWEYLLGTAANLAHAVQTLHPPEPYVIGDFNQRNVLVAEDARVTLIDCDSMQVPNPRGGEFLCPVNFAEFTPPELHGVDYATTPRKPSSDLFALAVHIHQLLLEGAYPFDGVWQGAGDKPKRPALAAQGVWVHAGDRRLAPPPQIIGADLLPPALRDLFHRAFVSGANDPGVRPSGGEWRRALQATHATLATCQAHPWHRYPAHHRSCPWCAHARRLVATATRQSTGTTFKPAAGVTTPTGPMQMPQAWTPPRMPAGTGGQRPVGGWAGPPPPRAPLPTGNGNTRRIATWAVVAAVAIGGIVAATQGSSNGGGTTTAAPFDGAGGGSSATRKSPATQQQPNSNGGNRSGGSRQRRAPVAQTPKRTRQSVGRSKASAPSSGGSGSTDGGTTQAPVSGGGRSGGGSTGGLQGSAGGGGTESGSGGSTGGLQGSSGGGSGAGSATGGLQGSPAGGGGLQGSASP